MGRNSRSRLIKIKLVEHGFTQRDIANALNFSEGYVSMLIKGVRINEAFSKWTFENLGITID